MLRCPCEIIKSFAFAKSKKGSVLPVSPFIRISLGCSCYHTKSVLFSIRQNQHFYKRDIRKSLFKEQKNFLWSSFLFWKDKKEESGLENAENVRKSDNKDKADSDKIQTVENFSAGTGKGVKAIKEKLISSDTIKNRIYKMSEKKKDDKNIMQNLFPKDSTKATPAEGSTGKEAVQEKKKNVELSKNIEVPLEGGMNRIAKEVYLGKIPKDIVIQQPSQLLTSESEKPKETGSSVEHSQTLIAKAKVILLKTTSALKSDEGERTPKVISLGEPKVNINLNISRRRQTVDLNRSSTERNFITPVRAMTDFLLKPSDLEGLRKTKRRSPYENDPPITVYWRKDVEAKAIDVWGSKENLLKEILKRDIERRRYQQNLFTVKRRLRDYRREQGRESEIKLEQNGLFGPSGKVVLTAIGINGVNFMFKLVAWIYTGSHSLFSEAIHSLADTINQLILAYGIHKSVQRADSHHPYGYTNMRYVASLISGVGIFCVGSGLSFYHGVVGLTDPSDIPSFYWAFFILLGSLISEGATLLVAFNSIRLGAKKSDMTFSEYVLRGQDPSVNVVLLEDFAAVIGVTFAGLCMGLSTYLNSHIPDAIGSFLVGGLLGGVASFIIYTNVAALVGRSIPQERLDKINSELEADVMIRAIHDVKGIDIGNSLVRYKAELDFDGGELTRSYLDKQDLNQMLEEVKKMKTIDELEEFMLKHGENIVDMMGGEIDRIELKLRKKHPEIRHCDLEIL